ncbi:MAG: TonB-dependent receptor, partial [Acidobacteriota bacterium]|nr:TonB-dependent receptor [Acidobacteriota bacterium]
MKVLVRCFACTSLILLFGMFIPTNAFAQVTATASLTGTILDNSGAVVPGARITVTNKSTGDTRTTTSGSNGLYRFDLLPVGTYTLQTKKEGFSTYSIGNIVLYVGQTTSQNATLSPGAVSQTITVTSAAPLIETTKSDVGMTITPSEVQSMPLNGRDFASLAELAPGARAVDPYDPTKRRYSTFAINGSSGRNVMVEVNGIDDKDNTIGGPVMQLPLSAVQEFSIATDRFSAANGRSEGGAVNVITKSGSNTLHGGLYLFDTETSLNANDYFSKQGNQPTPQFSRQQFGGDIGGPIRRDKDFFFFALERTRENTSIPESPTAFQELSLAKSIGADPATAIPTPFFEWRYNARLDHRFNANNTASLVYNSQKNNGLNDQSGNQNDLTAGNFTTNRLILASFNLNSVLSSHVVNSFTAGYQYWNNLIDTSKYSPYTVSFPSGAYFGTNINVPQESIQKKWQFKDDVSIIHGSHTIRTGVDFLWEPVLGGFFKYNAVPNVVFLQDATTIMSDPSTYPDGFATPGLVGEIFATTNGDPYFDLPGGDKQFGTYIQDDWQASHSLTLNLGLRWDRDFNLIGGSAQNINRTYLELRAIGSPYANRLPTDDNHGWGPRIGFAWNVRGDSKNIIRGGYGLYFGQTFLNIPLFMIQQSNPTLFGTAFDIYSTGPNDTTAPIVPGTGIPLNQWQFGVSPFPTIPPPASTLTNGATGRIMSPTYRNPYSEQWNIGYAYQPTQGSVIEVDYVHELGVHEGDRLNINPRLSSLAGARPLTAAFEAAQIPALGAIVDDESAGRSRYDALNVSYRRQMSRHFSINTNYVLSRAMAYDGSSAAFANYPINPLDQWSPTDF